MTTFTQPAPRLRSAWAAAHEPVAGVPRWARRAAFAVTLSVLPASLWRIGMEIHATIIGTADAGRGQVPEWMPMLVYVTLLSIGSELLAFTAYGMIARWGEVWPRWIPLLRGRRVPPLVALVPATLGSLILTTLWTWTAVCAVCARDIQWRPMRPDNVLRADGWEGWLVAVCYLPLLLWGPLLGALAIAYWRRRSSMGRNIST
ncbi:hypothetical protein [Flindersiella endophytica]